MRVLPKYVWYPTYLSLLMSNNRNSLRANLSLCCGTISLGSGGSLSVMADLSANTRSSVPQCVPILVPYVYPTYLALLISNNRNSLRANLSLCCGTISLGNGGPLSKLYIPSLISKPCGFLCQNTKQ